MNKLFRLRLFSRTLALMAVILLGAVAPRALAQTAPEIVGLTVQLWPEYDQPEMLVIMQGTLSAATALPATVTLTLPAEAQLHAVARPLAGSNPVTDIDYTLDGDQLTLTMTQPLFLVEYYRPMAIEGDQRSYEFVWQHDGPVTQLSAAVQQPTAATEFSVAPEPVNVEPGFNGLLYHSLASRPVAAGEPFDILMSYNSATGALSAPALAAQAPPAANTVPVAPAAQTGGLFDNFNPLWLLGIFGVAALVGLAFYFGRQQAAPASGRRRKPAPSRAAKPPVNRSASPPPAASPPAPPPATGPARFCHQCGEPLVAGDRFCRSCGTAIKSTG